MKNNHAAYLEINACSRKKISLQEQFQVFRYKTLIAKYILDESIKKKDAFTELTNVVEFENLLGECQKSIERVCNDQIEFWSQATNQLPDLNIFHDIGIKIYESTLKTQELWERICKINPCYPKALTLYGNYMIEVKNNTQAGYEMIEKYIYQHY